MSVGILSQDSFKNIALFVAIGVIALIAVVIIICAIVAHGKRKNIKSDTTQWAANSPADRESKLQELQLSR